MWLKYFFFIYFNKLLFCSLVSPQLVYQSFLFQLKQPVLYNICISMGLSLTFQVLIHCPWSCATWSGSVFTICANSCFKCVVYLFRCKYFSHALKMLAISIFFYFYFTSAIICYYTSKVEDTGYLFWCLSNDAIIHCWTHRSMLIIINIILSFLLSSHRYQAVA